MTKMIIPVLAVVAVLLSADPSHPQTVPVIEADLNAGTLKDFLPFDTPFQIKGPATNDLVWVNAWFKEKDSPDFVPFCRANWDSIIQPWKRFEGFDGDEFHILVPALNANRYYQFQFEFGRSLSEEELADFREAARETVDLELREVETINDMKSNVLQGRLVKAIPKAPNDAVRWPSNSIFDPSVKGMRALEAKLKQVHDLLSPQVEKQAVVGNIERSAPTAAKSLLVFTGDINLQAIERAVRQVSDKDASAAKWLPAAGLCLALSGLTADHAELIAYGFDTLGLDVKTPSPLDKSTDSLWKPPEVDPRIENLQTSILGLQKVGRLVEAVAVDASMVQADSILKTSGTSTFRELAQKLKAARDGLVGVRAEYLNLKILLQERSERITELVELLEVETKHQVSILAVSGNTFATRARSYISADFGLSYVPTFDEILAYFGVNFYFKPVNKEVPLRQKGGFGRRFALMLGITIESVEKTNERKGVLGNKGLVYGTGIRLTDYVRASVGGVVFYRVDPNPLISEERLWTEFLFSLSFDSDIAGLLGKLGAAVGKQ